MDLIKQICSPLRHKMSIITHRKLTQDPSMTECRTASKHELMNILS